MFQEDQALGNLKNSIHKLQIEKQNALGSLRDSRSILNEMQLEYSKMENEQSFLKNLIKEKEKAIKDYEKIIQESESAYSKLTDNSKKLLETIETEQRMMKFNDDK